MVASVGGRGSDNIRCVDMGGAGGSGPFLYGSDNEPERATYGASIFGVAPPANPTDFLTMRIGAAKVVRLKSIIIAGTATSAANILVALTRCTGLNTTPSVAAVSAIAHDGSDPNPFLTVEYATANPAAVNGGALTLHRQRLNLAPAANGSIDRVIWQFTWQNDKAPVIRNANSQFAINLGGQAMPAGALLDIDLMWTEE
jgi:hypothetical protein